MSHLLASLTVVGQTGHSRLSPIAILADALVIGIVSTLGQTVRVVGTSINIGVCITLDIVVDADVLLHTAVSNASMTSRIARNDSVLQAGCQREVLQRRFQRQWQSGEQGRTELPKGPAQERCQQKSCRTWW